MSNSQRFYRDPRSADAISWNSRHQRFLCCDQGLSLSDLGRMIARAKVHGEDTVRLDFVRKHGGGSTTSYSRWLAVDYLLAMMDFVAQHGWFWDAVEDLEDHAFDPHTITPGVYWSGVVRLRAVSAELLQSQGRDDRQLAKAAAALGAQLSEEAAQLLVLGVPSRS